MTQFAALLVMAPLFLPPLAYVVAISRWEPVAVWATAVGTTLLVFGPGHYQPIAPATGA